MELENQGKIRTLGEKETYKNMGILETDTIKKVLMKEKIKKNISEEPESYPRRSNGEETLSKKLIPGLYPSLYIRDNFRRVPEKN